RHETGAALHLSAIMAGMPARQQSSIETRRLMFGFLKKSPRPDTDAPEAPEAESPTPIETSVVEAAPTAPTAPRPSWGERLKAGLSRTRSNLAGLFGLRGIDEDLFEDVESTLLMADCGVEATQFLIDELRKRWKRNEIA